MKRYLELQFFLHEKEDFEGLVKSQGFEITELNGGYSRSEFDPGKSPFMIYSLTKA